MIVFVPLPVVRFERFTACRRVQPPFATVLQFTSFTSSAARVTTNDCGAGDHFVAATVARRSLWPGHAALVGGETGGAGEDVYGGGTGEEGKGPGGAAVVGEGAEQGVDCSLRLFAWRKPIALSCCRSHCRRPRSRRLGRGRSARYCPPPPIPEGDRAAVSL